MINFQEKALIFNEFQVPLKIPAVFKEFKDPHEP